MQLSSLVNMVIGVWLMVSPVVLGYGGVAAVNDVALGATVIGVAVFALVLPALTASSWINVFCGIWLVFAPAFLSYQHLRVPASNDIAMGLLITIIASVRVCTLPRLRA